MSAEQSKPTGPDLTKGVAADEIPDGGMIGGHVGDEAVLIARRGDEFFAIGATCSHYNGPLAEGLVVGDTVRCPWHHARFSLRSGEAIGAPAFNPVSCWRVEQRDGKIFVRERNDTDRDGPRPPAAKVLPASRSGSSSSAAARPVSPPPKCCGARDLPATLTLLSADADAPYDRPNCSKDYLAGNAPEDWMPLRPAEFYKDQAIDLRLSADVKAIDGKTRSVTLASGDTISFDKLLLATGAEPVHLDIPGRGRAAGSRAALARRFARDHRRRRRPHGSAVVIGASFIGLEAAAALRARDIEVHVVAPERRPLERVLGAEYGDMIRALHEEHGVVFPSRRHRHRNRRA